jgi:rubrerythrin
MGMSVHSGLTSLEVLGIAIQSEIEAAKLYERMERKIKNVDLKEKLEFLKGEEEKHRSIFEDIYRKRYPDVELILPEKSMVPMMDGALTKEMSLQELFEVALKAEKISEEFYTDLARKSKDVSGTSMLNYLSGIERGHYNLLKNEYDMVIAFPAYAETEEFLMSERLTHVGP